MAGKRSETTVYTFGYQGRPFVDLQAAMIAHRIQCVVDVRHSPNSRRPEWRRGSLERHLDDRYLWLGALGNQGSNGRVRLVDEERGLEELVEVLDGCQPGWSLLLLCYEEDAACCHRSYVARQLAGRVPGLRIEHL
jgi:uncharacterized protein (DUF488 family)